MSYRVATPLEKCNAATMARWLAADLCEGASLDGLCCGLCVVRERTGLGIGASVDLGAREARQMLAGGVKYGFGIGTIEEQSIFPLLMLADDMEAGLP